MPYKFIIIIKTSSSFSVNCNYLSCKLSCMKWKFMWGTIKCFIDMTTKQNNDKKHLQGNSNISLFKNYYVYAVCGRRLELLKERWCFEWVSKWVEEGRDIYINACEVGRRMGGRRFEVRWITGGFVLEVRGYFSHTVSF